MGKYFAGTLPLAKALKAHLDKAGIRPVFDSDLPTITATRQAAGDVEYLFAVNATYDPGQPARTAKNAVQAAAATLALPDDGRPVYDAVARRAGAAVPAAGRQARWRPFRFGAGQMRVFARTARPIGGVRAGDARACSGNWRMHEQPLAVEFAATRAGPRRVAC